MQADGEVYVGVAPQEYCYTRAGKLLPDELPARGKREKGLISARIVQEEDGDAILVSVPDGAVLVVKKGETEDHPKELSPNVSLRSWHPICH
jgi:hypothetical protein